MCETEKEGALAYPGMLEMSQHSRARDHACLFPSAESKIWASGKVAFYQGKSISEILTIFSTHLCYLSVLFLLIEL
jgi:hypothetical protein